MNYPSMIVNPILQKKEPKSEKTDTNLDELYQAQNGKDFSKIKAPFTKYSVSHRKTPSDVPIPNANPLKSSYALTTTTLAKKSLIVLFSFTLLQWTQLDENSEKCQKYSYIKPQSCELGKIPEESIMNFTHKKGEIGYSSTTTSEEIRNLTVNTAELSILIMICKGLTKIDYYPSIAH